MDQRRVNAFSTQHFSILNSWGPTRLEDDQNNMTIVASPEVTNAKQMLS